MPSRPPRPREPTASIWAPAVAVSSTERGGPNSTCRSTVTSGCSFSYRVIRWLKSSSICGAAPSRPGASARAHTAMRGTSRSVASSKANPRVAGDLPGHRPEQRAGQPALTVRADHDHLGGAAPLAQHRGGLTFGQHGPNLGDVQERVSEPDGAGDDLLGALPGLAASFPVAGQGQVSRPPGEADGQYRP